MKFKTCCEKWEERWAWAKWDLEKFNFCPWCGDCKTVVKKERYKFLVPTDEEVRAGMVMCAGRPTNMAMQEKRAQSPRPSSADGHTVYQLWRIACQKTGYDCIGIQPGGYARKIGV